MKKKLFFKLFIFAIIGSLATMTSCKDYDDDINGLETEVAGLKTELTSLNSDISSAQTAATQALAKAQEALTAAQAAGKASDVAALQTQVAAIQTQLTALSGLKAEVTALMTELETANAKQLADIKAEVQTLSDQLKAMLGGMVTNVSLMLSESTNTDLGYDENLLFNTIKEVENVFEEGIDGAITFVKDRQIQTSDFFVIRVSPSNVEITPEMITLQNSKGEPYDNIEVVSVVPYDKLLTRSTANGSGLWKVTVQLKEYVKADFDAATLSNNNPILFAVAVDNTKTAENPMVRKVISTYDLALIHSATEPTMPTSINYFIGDKTVNFASAYPAVQNQPFEFKLTNGPSDANVVEPQYIRAFYVTLNTEGVSEHDLNLWKSYNITGLNKVIEKNAAGELKTSISIGANTAIDDEIEFRVYAVNIKGQLVVNDGKVFKVKVGKESTNWSAVNTVATPSSTILTKSAEVAVSTLTKLSSPASATWKSAKTDDPAFDAIFLDKDGNKLYETSSLNTFPADFSKVTKIYTMPISAWTAFEDGKSYTRTLTIFNSSGHVLASLDVTFTKVLPTAAPEGFQALAGQLVNGVYNSIMTPSDVNGVPAIEIGATHGTTVRMDQIFAFGSSTKANYSFSFANSAKDADGKSIAKVVTGGTNALTVAKEFIDNTTEHVTTVKYNYGAISSKTENASGYVVPVYEFKTVYSNIYKTYTWNWATREQLGGDYLKKDEAGNYTEPLPATSVKQGAIGYTVSAAHIYGVSTIPTYNVFLSNAQKLVIQSAKLISDATNNEDYFTVSYDTDSKVFNFTEKPASALTVSVPSKLVITAKDFYNNDVVIKIPVTVTP